MLDNKTLNLDEYRANARSIRVAESGDPALGPLKYLPGTWKNTEPSGQARGWNMIALPFFQDGARRNYRLLMNRYQEELKFTFVDDMVPNRGVLRGTAPENTDQLVVALDYQQKITQTLAEDSAGSALAGAPDLAIHHEPGLFLQMRNFLTNEFNIARLATVPHGNAATAIGKSQVIDGPPQVPSISGFPVGVAEDVDIAIGAATEDSYLFPYKHYVDAPFDGLFSPDNPNRLLQVGLPQNVRRTTVLDMSTDTEEGGIRTIPFIEKQADANFMRSVFWIMEFDEPGLPGEPKLMLAYSQFIFLDFFDRFDSEPGLIRWPHVSINVMEKVALPSRDDPYLTPTS